LELKYRQHILLAVQISVLLKKMRPQIYQGQCSQFQKMMKPILGKLLVLLTNGPLHSLTCLHNPRAHLKSTHLQMRRTLLSFLMMRTLQAARTLQVVGTLQAVTLQAARTLQVVGALQAVTLQAMTLPVVRTLQAVLVVLGSCGRAN
jgi:hypothetical protein